MQHFVTQRAFAQTQRDQRGLVLQFWGCHQGVLVFDGKFSQGRFGKHFGTMEGSGKVLDVWYGIAIWNGDVVQGSVVTTRSPVAVGLFRDHM